MAAGYRKRGVEGKAEDEGGRCFLSCVEVKRKPVLTCGTRARHIAQRLALHLNDMMDTGC